MVTLSERKKINKQTNAFCLMDKKEKQNQHSRQMIFSSTFYLSSTAVRSFTQSICVCWISYWCVALAIAMRMFVVKDKPTWLRIWLRFTGNDEYISNTTTHSVAIFFFFPFVLYRNFAWNTIDLIFNHSIDTTIYSFNISQFTHTLGT